MTTEAKTKKPTKAEQLTAQLAKARIELEALRVKLKPALDAHAAKLDELKKAESKADKARWNAWEEHKLVCAQTPERLGLKARGQVVPELYAAVEVHLGELATPERVLRAADAFISRIVAADELVLVAAEKDKAANKAHERTRRALTAHEHDEGHRSRTRALLAAQERVDELEHELARLPKLREAERDRRAAARAEELEGQAADKVTERMSTFTWTPAKSEQA